MPLVNSNNSNPDEAYYIDKKTSEIKDAEEIKKYLKTMPVILNCRKQH